MVERYSIILHAYVLLGSHYHLLIESPEGNVSQAMQWLNTSYSVWFNVKRERTGALFQYRFKSIPVDSEGSWAFDCALYIHLNPVRVKNLGLGKKERAIGSASFIEKLRRNVLKDKGTNSNERQWRRLLPFSDIVAAVEKVKGERWTDFCRRYGDRGRDLAMHVGRQRSGLTLKEIGEHTGMKVKAVSQCESRIRKRLEEDKPLKEQYQKILDLLGENDEL